MISQTSQVNTERLWYVSRIGSERDWIWPPDILNSLQNGITRDSQDDYQDIITAISATDCTAESLHMDIQGLCGHMQRKIWQHSHRTVQHIHREFMKKSGSGSMSVGRGWEEMTGYPAMMNHTNCVDLRNLRKSKWDQELGKIEKSSWKFLMPTLKQT